MKKRAVLLINLGTPDSPSVRDVRVYLREFLMDGRVIDMNPVGRWFLVNGMIAPFRAPSSAKGYRELWTAEGSPLKVYGNRVRDLLQERLKNECDVFLAMRYQNPSIRSVLKAMEGKGYEEIVVINLYPQYASASTGTNTEEVMKHLRAWQVIPDVRFVNQFFDHPKFIAAFKSRGEAWLSRKDYDHILFSYHGLPERQIRKASVGNYCRLDTCCSVMSAKNRYCYRAQCFATTRLLIEALGLKEGTYSTSFQSRLGSDPWIQPYTEPVIKELCQKGVKKLLVFSPAFVADCLETIVEIGTEYTQVFKSHGGEELDLVESLNDLPEWIDCLEDLTRGAAVGEEVALS